MSRPGTYHDECGDIMSTQGDLKCTGVSVQIQWFYEGYSPHQSCYPPVYS